MDMLHIPRYIIARTRELEEAVKSGRYRPNEYWLACAHDEISRDALSQFVIVKEPKS